MSKNKNKKLQKSKFKKFIRARYKIYMIWEKKLSLMQTFAISYSLRNI